MVCIKCRYEYTVFLCIGIVCMHKGMDKLATVSTYPVIAANLRKNKQLNFESSKT